MLVDCTKYSSLVFILYTEALQVVTQTVIFVKWHCMSLDPCAYRVSRRPLDH